LAGLKDTENQEEDFEEGTYKWTMVKGVKHGFTHHFRAKPAHRKAREMICEGVYEKAHMWLQDGPLQVS